MLNVFEANVKGCLFKDNLANEKDGGAIYGGCPLDMCTYNFTSSTFTGNSAKKNGGAIDWTYAKPTIEDNVFINNSAEYGPDIASYGFGLTYIDVLTGASQKLWREGGEVREIASGQRIPLPLKIGLVDHYNQIVKTDNESICDLLPANSTSTSVTGTTRVTAKQGIYEFSDIIISADPLTQISIKVSSDVLNLISVSNDSDFVVPFKLRACESGEEKVGGECKRCPASLYSIDPGESCKECPEGAICYGGSLMVPKKEYWRASKTTDQFQKCLVDTACLGSPNVVPSLTGDCLQGYRGNLCQACDNGYSRSAPNQCGKCPDLTANVLKLLGLFLAVCVMCGVLVNSSMKTAYVPTSLHSIYLKIFTNYMQLVLLTTQLNLEWPDFVMQFFASQSYATSVDQQIFSFDCYLSGSDSKGDTYKDIFFERLVLISCLPLIIGCIAGLFWVIVYYYFDKRKSIFRKELVATFVILFFLVHPNLVKEYFATFGCQRIGDDDTLWLNYNLDIKCFDDMHALYGFTVALPSIIIWGLGVPTMILGFLIYKRQELDSIIMKCRFGFFYNGFRKSHFYWEFLILYRKIIIICLVVFVGNSSIPIQALTIMLLVLFFLYLQYWQKPYTTKALNRMELKAIFVAGVTIYCGLYYLTKNLDQNMKIFLFCFMVFANAYFFYWFAYEFMLVVLQMLGTKIKLFKKFAVKYDAFPGASIVSHNFRRASSYLTQDLTLKASISPSVNKFADIPYSQNLTLPKVAGIKSITDGSPKGKSLSSTNRTVSTDSFLDDSFR
mmetsp:Transcript_19548/g.35784  ORF Transcript_19548/g.35784 Transcript_19548/m.35784 type:complete len:783 (-) Transcript_19548:1495-3843(-)